MVIAEEVGNLECRHKVEHLEDVQFLLNNHRLGKTEVKAVVLELESFPSHVVQQYDAIREPIAVGEREGNHLW